MTAASLHTGTRLTQHADSRGIPNKKIACVYCKGAHTANRCDVITDHQRRLDVVKKERLCFNCLAHHKVSECKSKHRCNTCKRKHHTSLCNGRDNTNGKNESSNQNVTPTSHTLLSTMPKSMNTQPNGLGQVECKPDACLLKTAVAIVTAGDKQTRANILFDDGAQRSFVSQKLADLLNLNPQTRENITISSFGANTPIITVTKCGQHQCKVTI